MAEERREDPEECVGSGNQRKQTSTASRFSESTFMEALSQVRLYCHKKALRKKLKENAGKCSESARTSFREALMRRRVAPAER